MAQVVVVTTPKAPADRPRTQQSEDAGHHGGEGTGPQLLAQSWAAQKAGKPSADFPPVLLFSRSYRMLLPYSEWVFLLQVSLPGNTLTLLPKLRFTDARGFPESKQANSQN